MNLLKDISLNWKNRYWTISKSNINYLSVQKFSRRHSHEPKKGGEDEKKFTRRHFSEAKKLGEINMSNMKGFITKWIYKKTFLWTEKIGYGTILKPYISCFLIQKFTRGHFCETKMVVRKKILQEDISVKWKNWVKAIWVI